MTKPKKKRMDANIDLQERALRLISMNPDGILQTELRMILGIDSAKCSKVVSKLEMQGHISKERPPGKVSRTYLIRLASRPVPQSQRAHKSHRDDSVQKTLGEDLALKDHKKDFLSSNIDSYLTEIYLLYLIRGAAK